MERYGFHTIKSIQASDAYIMTTLTEGQAVDRSIEKCLEERFKLLKNHVTFKKKNSN